MELILNGEAARLPDDATVADVLRHLEAPDRGVAVAVDAAVVPRSQWESTRLSEGARVEVVQAVQGG